MARRSCCICRPSTAPRSRRRAIGIGTDAFTLVRKGAPIKMAKMNPMGLSNWAFYMMKDVEHPNLAKLWGYWITTADGQKALAEVDGTGFTTSAGAPISDLVKGVKIGWLTRDYMKKNGRRLIKKYAKMMKIRWPPNFSDGRRDARRGGHSVDRFSIPVHKAPGEILPYPPHPLQPCRCPGPDPADTAVIRPAPHRR